MAEETKAPTKEALDSAPVLKTYLLKAGVKSEAIVNGRLETLVGDGKTVTVELFEAQAKTMEDKLLPADESAVILSRPVTDLADVTNQDDPDDEGGEPDKDEKGGKKDEGDNKTSSPSTSTPTPTSTPAKGK